MLRFWFFFCTFLFVICNSGCAEKAQSKNLTIALQPFDGFPQNLLDTISATLELQFAANVIQLPTMELPKSAFVNIKSPRYRGDSLIKQLRTHKNADYDLVLGLTTKDISITKKDLHNNVLEPRSKYEDWGVFGVATFNAPYAVVSTYRLNAKHALFIDRVVKICIHEIGHTLALPHCENSSCLMQDAAETIQTIDQVTGVFCESCLNKVFDFSNR